MSQAPAELASHVTWTTGSSIQDTWMDQPEMTRHLSEEEEEEKRITRRVEKISPPHLAKNQPYEIDFYRELTAWLAVLGPGLFLVGEEGLN